MRFLTRALAVMAALLAVSTPTMADLSVVFSTKEIAIIRDYYTHAQHDGGGKAKAGKQKQQGLPPGVAKNLARGKALPPGIAKQQLPGDLSQRLPPVRDGYERVIIDGRVLLVEIATQLIHDVLMDAIFD
jgi:hypothetical protein